MENLNTPQNRTLSVKDWVINMIVVSLPVIGLIMLLVWAFSDDTNIHKKNWAKGMLIFYLISVAIAFILIFFMGGIAFPTGAMNQ